MRIAVVGLGGVGGYFGGMLARAFRDHKAVKVVFLTRGEHLRQIRRRGLEVITPEKTITAVPTLATDDVSAAGPLDLVFMCVKGYDLESAATAVRSQLHPHSNVISLLNGVDNAERLGRVFSSGKVLNGCVYISSHIAGPGLVHQTGGTCQLFFGPEDATLDEGKALETLLREGEIKATHTTDIRTVVWEKFLFVAPLASATAHLGQPFGAFARPSSNRTLLEGLMDEVARVGTARGVQWPEGAMDKALAKIGLFPSDTKSSLQLDFEKGRKTEIETFTGYVVKSGRELGVKTPLHATVYAALRAKTPH